MKTTRHAAAYLPAQLADGGQKPPVAGGGPPGDLEVAWGKKVLLALRLPQNPVLLQTFFFVFVREDLN